ncbi:MAG: hypothetical protein PHH21_02160 [Candidatus Pacebacteria bacterium]|nr:hypothetical protein [Candidatus Paceibacterota bacterium]
MSDSERALKERVAFFEKAVRNRRVSQLSAILIGLVIVVCLLYSDFAIVPHLGTATSIIMAILTPFIIVLVARFIWAPWDVCWLFMIKPNYYKILTRGGKRIGVFSDEVDFNDKWEPIPKGSQDNAFHSTRGLGMHINWGWPFTQVYEEKVEYKRWYVSLQRAILKRELMTQFSLMVFPHYAEVIGAKDAKKADVDMGITPMLRVTNVEKAHFRETTSWIEITTDLFVGGMNSFIQTHTTEQIRSAPDAGKDLYDNMPSPNPGWDQLVKMIEDTYGITTESISRNFFRGEDEEVEEAMRAMAIAEFRRDAKLIDGDADRKVLSMTTIGAALDMLVMALVTTEDIPEKQAETIKETRNELVSLRKDKPEEFEKKYGQLWRECLDIVQRDVTKKGGVLADMRTPDSTDGDGVGSMQKLILTSNLIGPRNQKSTEPDNSGKTTARNSKKKRDNDILKDAGFDLLDEDEE